MAPVALATSPKLSPQQRRFSQSKAAHEVLAQSMIAHALQSHIENIDPDQCEAGGEDAFFVADLGEIYRQHMRWKVNLPRIEPFYGIHSRDVPLTLPVAVKCNQDPAVLRLLAKLGTGFDCASKTEIKQILDLGVEPHRIIYANPCKTASYVRYAADNNIRMMTFDNPEELYKVKKFFPDASLVLRISTDDSKALCRLSLKYGAPLDSTADLLRLANELELNVIGVSFHVGSGSTDPSAFVTAVKDARKVFDEAAEVGYDLRMLDVGGGYGTDNLEQIAAMLGPAVDRYFPPSIRVIAEPGRYYVETAFTIATHVIARRTVQEDMMAGQPSYMLYLNDGVYGNFSNIIFDHQHPVPRVLKHGPNYYYNSLAKDSQLTRYSVWGPTCDGIDCISSSCFLPEVLEVGDWLYFNNMGAYSKCSATKFNGFNDDHRVMYVVSEAGAQALLES
ncbi:pyridoxal-dependent decarboxylase [Sphaerosporella brunnea]|uniref:Ornithine decarboxylase n=1 Tax=Sphaerosporella brunnea TaxID=1250544 RepID=A0A5J5EX92_9PEZI|nr:pyridoxal-dependent decarboxylase [Sphaerosporella brunnea]